MKKNLFFSFVSKGINALTPLVLIPICNKIFGIESFGEMVYYQSLVGLLITFADYGFSVTGLKTSSQVSESPTGLGKLFIEVTSIKIIFLLFGVLTVVGYLFYFQQTTMNFQSWTLFFLVFFTLSIQSIIPFWLFQGVKKNKEMAIVNFFSKLILLGLVFTVVQQGQHISSFASAELISYVFALAYSFYLLSRTIKINNYYPDLTSVKNQIITGFDYFLIVLIYWAITGGSMLVLKNDVDAFELGFFGLFLRFSYYTFAIFQPVIHTLIPYFTEKFTDSSHSAIVYYKKIFLFFLAAIAILFSVIVFLLPQLLKIGFEPSIYEYFLANKWIAYFLIIKIFFELLNNFTANSLLLTNGKTKNYRNAQFLNFLIVTVLYFLLIPRVGSIGASIAMLTGEVVFFLFIFNNTYKYLFVKHPESY